MGGGSRLELSIVVEGVFPIRSHNLLDLNEVEFDALCGEPKTMLMYEDQEPRRPDTE